MRSIVARIVIAIALASPVRAADLATGMADFVEGLETETDECDFLRSLCRGTRASNDRVEGTPPAADLLVTRQALIAEQRFDETVAAAEAIQRKRGKRLPCFDEKVCQGIVPRPKPEPAR